jgi:hypothetical protein
MNRTSEETTARHPIHSATLAKLSPVAIDIGEMLAGQPRYYVDAWLRWARRLLVKVVATAPLSDRHLLIIQLDMVDDALDVVELASKNHRDSRND